jgi:phage shock protein A
MLTYMGYIILSFIVLALGSQTKVGRALYRRLRSGDAAVAQSLTDISADSNLAIEDARKELRDLKGTLAELVTETNRIEIQLEEAKGDVSKYENIAVKAGQAGNAEDVRGALEQKAVAVTLTETLAHQIQENEALEVNLRKQCEDYEKAIRMAKGNATRYIAQIKGAELRQRLAQRAQNFDANGLAGLDMLKDRAVDATAGAQAWEEIGTGEPKRLEDKYATATVADDEVSKYLKLTDREMDKVG